jgi:hypothetical protein
MAKEGSEFGRRREGLMQVGARAGEKSPPSVPLCPARALSIPHSNNWGVPCRTLVNAAFSEIQDGAFSHLPLLQFLYGWPWGRRVGAWRKRARESG